MLLKVAQDSKTLNTNEQNISFKAFVRWNHYIINIDSIDCTLSFYDWI